MKILKIYLNLFLLSTLIFSRLYAQNDEESLRQEKLILLSDITESSEQYGFYQLELRLVSTFNSTQNYLLKIYNVPNKNLMLADGDIIYKGSIKSLADKQFIIYLKPIKEGNGNITFKIKTQNKEYQFKAKYEVTNRKSYNEEKNLSLEKLSLKVYSPKIINNDNISNKTENPKEEEEHSNLENSPLKTIILNHQNTKKKIIKIVLAIISFFIIIGMLYYKKRTRFFK